MSMPALPGFVTFYPALDPFGEGTEMRCVLDACVPYFFNGALARRKKTVLGKSAIKIRVRHDIPHSPNTTRWPLVPGDSLLSPRAQPVRWCCRVAWQNYVGLAKSSLCEPQ